MSNKSNAPSTESGKHPRNPNWGGLRANSGRKKRKLPPLTNSESRADQQGSPAVLPYVHRSATPSTSTAPAAGFFAPRVHNSPTTPETADMDVQIENQANQAILGSSLTSLGKRRTESNDSSDILHLEQGMLSWYQSSTC
jgi:hypothetical protein